MRATEADFDLVRQLVMKLPDVDESTIHGAPSWKLGGKLLACPAIHKSAEADSLLVKIAPEERAELVCTKPGTYYVTSHYQRQPVVLIRLSQIDRNALQALLKRAWQFANETGSKPRKRRKS